MKWALKRHCSERDYILFVVGCETGLRVGDLLRLTTQQILELKGKQNKISGSRKAKHKKNAICKISRNAFRGYCHAKNVQKGRLPHSPNSGLQAVQAAEFAGLVYVGNHNLRNTFGLLVLQSQEGYCHASTDPASFPSFCHPTSTQVGITRRRIKQFTKNMSVFI